MAQIEALLAELPGAAWHHYEPVSRDNVRAGTMLAYGTELEPHIQLDRADVILSLDADFLARGAAHIRHTREFSRRRRVSEESASMNRLYVVEPTPSITGGMADHRLPLRANDIDGFARAVARRLGLSVSEGKTSAPSGWLDAVAKDLEAHRGTSLVVAGEDQPPAVHALAHAMNETLGNVGQTVTYTSPIEASPKDQEGPVSQANSLKDLVRDMRSGDVEMLLILEGNPVYDAPSDHELADAMSDVPYRLHLGPYYDETAELCHWHINQAHELESWGDIRAFDGTVTLLQPLIEPLYAGKTPNEVLSVFLGQPTRGGYEIVRDHWKRTVSVTEFEKFWETALHDGLIQGSAFETQTPTLRSDLNSALPSSTSGGEGMDLLFRPDPHIFDGRFSNNGWLQELSKPLTRLTWENAALIGPADAARLGLENGDVVEINNGNASVRAPIWKLPGQAPGTVTLHLGYGRSRSGKIGNKIGFNAYAIRTSDSPWQDTNVEIVKTGERQSLASTQMHHTMDGRHLIRQATLSEYQEHPHFAHEMGHEPDEAMTLYPKQENEGYAWGMTIDLNACIGCDACSIACQSENNIPVVGKTEVMRGREMSWIRVDRYFEGDDIEAPEIVHQPVPCMHCENAPCEPVCPVGATAHGPEGLNEMAYNRCVGTRYCSNNCPYKVRRFNFLMYSDYETPVKKLMTNPDVTVRTRGIMEKCTYCVQRINTARIQAKKEDRTIRDGDVVTACQSACPAEAIVFGDINDKTSRVSELKSDPRNYGILTELNVRPRTTYLAKLRNPNPELEES